MPRAFVCVLDSFGIGAAPDAAAFGDAGANTLGHIALACANGSADIEGLRSGPLHVPNLVQMGLARAAVLASGETVLDATVQPDGLFGCAVELSRGKDTPSGHWELMGLPVTRDWGHFPDTVPSFPAELIDALINEASLPGVLGNCHASGTVILDDLGEEHIRTGKPIVYTSADSIFQIAAHEECFGLDRLYEVCRVARKLVDELNIGRVIARPFVGETKGAFTRTTNRKDFGLAPHGPTLLDLAMKNGRNVVGIGKIQDIFSGSGVGRSVKAPTNKDAVRALQDEIDSAPVGSLILANLAEFDTLFGHRRDIPGYAACLEEFDELLPGLLAGLREGDALVLTADHGCDPSWVGSDHTREYIPILMTGPGIASSDIGVRPTFADVGQSLACHLGLPALEAGTSFL